MSEDNLRGFMCFSGSKIHASIDGLSTLCGIDIDDSWTEFNLKDYHRLCKRCQKIYPKTFVKGKQATLEQRL